MQFKIKKLPIIILFITILSYQNNLFSNTQITILMILALYLLMYHRFEENKYPSTNIRIIDFINHLKIIEDNKINFVNPSNFENELKNNKSQRKILLNN